VECGHHYARALSSWSLLLALTGFQHSAVEQRLEFAPRLSQTHFAAPYTTGNAFGRYSQSLEGQGRGYWLEVEKGRLSLREWIVPASAPGGPPLRVTITNNGEGASPPVPAEMRLAGERLTIRFPEGVQVRSGQTLMATIE